jgi:mono/diheme cytochrome c family protein/glucose/arabinose dehydrogenase
MQTGTPHSLFGRLTVVAVLVYVGCFALTAQTPAPARGQTPVAAPPAAPPATPAPPQVPGGRGSGGGQDPFEGADLSPKEPITAVSPAEQQKRFVLPPGYRIEPVLTDPDIEEPMQIAFDGNGRMYVLEIRSYMQDGDATGELDPVNRISWHEDTNHDGTYDKHGVFVDNLVFPRFVMPYGANAILTMESNTDDVWKYTDTNHDGVGDKKEIFTSNFGRAGNVEHQQSSLLWGLDNWLYSTYNAFRVRFDGSAREPTAANQSQWGITQDDDGKVWFQGGASGLPGYFQFPIHYGLTFPVANYMEPGFEIPWGVAGVGDFQPGTSAIRRPELTLNRVTGAAGNAIVRGHRMPRDLLGDYLYGEPVARIVRRVRPVASEGLTTLRNVYQWEHAEFIRSTDHLFRPVDIATAPDGSVYIVDAYRGIIQEGTWTQPGSYLRAKIDQFKLAEQVRRGRIWRLTYDGLERDRVAPRMLSETAAQLVPRLGHPNGWWRDTAQQQIVLKQDKSVVPALEQMARTSANPVARIHATWTLEGLGALDAGLVRQLIGDPDPRLRIHGIRVSETLYKAGDRSFASLYEAAAKDGDVDVAVQALLTLNVLKVANLKDIVSAAIKERPARGVQEVGRQILNPPVAAFGRGNRSPAEIASLERGQAIYKELCFSCHGDDGRGAPMPGDASGALMAPALATSARVQAHRDYVINTILHGLTGPIDGKTYAGGVMAPMATNSDQWIADVASFVRSSFGNTASAVTPGDVARVRAATADRQTFWTATELLATLPSPLMSGPGWTVTASHNSAQADGALTFKGWSSGAPQQPGMWLQVEMPEAATITEIQFNSASSGGGRGNPPVVGFPRACKIEVSLDGSTWTTAAEGQGVGSSTTIAFKPVRARFVKITQTATPSEPAVWSVVRLRVFQQLAN